MKLLCIVLVCVYILLLTYYEVKKIKETSEILNEMLSLINFCKTELRYRSTDISALSEASLNIGLKYISLVNGKLTINKNTKKSILQTFNSFISKLGTTDNEGQLSLCDEYISTFRTMQTEAKQTEKSKVKINTALGVLGAVTVIVFFV